MQSSIDYLFFELPSNSFHSLSQSGFWCPSYPMKMRFHSHDEIHFHINGCAPDLAFVEA